jgi:predicted nuclease of predicted toxin-antitoxin system
MKFLVDAHLPRHLALLLREHGYDAIHTLDLAEGNRTTDNRINEISEMQRRVVITKDADFVNSFLISKRPYKLLLISTGNISNQELEGLFVRNLPAIVLALTNFDYMELTRTSLIEHG